MNKNDYKKAMNGLRISEDFIDRTTIKMKEARKEETTMKINPKDNKQSGKNSVVFRRFAVSAASLAVLVAVGTVAFHLPGNGSPEKGNSLKVESIDTGKKTAAGTTTPAGAEATGGITVPTVKLPDSNSAVTARMLPLFVYKGHIYVQSATAFETTDGMTLDKEDVLALRGDFLGKTKGSLNEWSSQKDYDKEFASTIGEGDVYTVKGYDSDHRLMVYYEYEGGGFGCELYDSFGGMTIKTGEDYFKLLNLNGNVASYQWQSFNSWNNGVNDIQKGTDTKALEAFLDSLNTAVPLGENLDMLTENTDYDGQKFVDIKTKDKLVTTLRLFKGGYVYDSQIGFFKVDDKAFQTFWDTMPVTDTADGSVSNGDTSNAALALTLSESSLPVGTKELKATIKNNGSEDVFFGADYSLEKLKGSKWVVVPGMKDMAFIDIAYSVAPGSEQEFTADLSQLKPSLDAGKYRLVKNINGQTFYGEFELK